MRPNSKGYYWRVGNYQGEHREMIVEVDNLRPSDPNDWYFWVHGELGAIFILEDTNVKWFGPIPDLATCESVFETLHKQEVSQLLSDIEVQG